MSPDMVTEDPPVLRTAAEMRVTDAWLPRAPAPADKVIPTIPLGDYGAAKARAAAQTHGSRQESLPIAARAPAASVTGAGNGGSPSLFASFPGLNQTMSGPADSLVPDCDGAVGTEEYVEIVDAKVAVYNRVGTLLSSIGLQAFFNESDYLMNPRVLYDPTWKRWIIVATRRGSATETMHWFRIAVSQTSDAKGAYYEYTAYFNGPVGCWWDFPGLGMDQDSILVTGDVFAIPYPPYDYLGAALGVFAKARLYNGLSLTSTFFYGLSGGSLAPPVVLDQNASTYLVSAPPDGDAIRKYTLTNSSRIPGAALSGPELIPVTAYSVPPPAPQPGTCQTINTLDNRFLSRSTQIGNQLWQVHTVGIRGLPTLVWYKLDTESNAVVESGLIYSSPTSSDFNASIAANASGDVFVTWTSTDPANDVYPQVRFSGKLAGGTSILSGSAAAASPTIWAPTTSAENLWSDYSAVSIDPADQTKAWIINENVHTRNIWGTVIGKIGF